MTPSVSGPLARFRGPAPAPAVRLFLSGLLLSSTLFSGQPVPVSPGSPTGARVGASCPTFSWSAVTGATSHELVVYRVAQEGEEPEPVVRRSFAGAVGSWTPSLDACLERGGRYAWSVRAAGPGQKSEWSAPILFEVASAPSAAELEEAVAVVRRYLAGSGGDLSGASGGSSSSAGAAPAVAGPAPAASPAAPAPRAAVAGDPALIVNGAAVVTTATLGAGICVAVDYRYVDRSDGTVLDCNTGRVWLKDASCLGSGVWSSEGAFSSAQWKVGELNTGGDLGCVDYTPGTYTDWELPALAELCGLWDGSCTGTSCCTATAGLVDTTFSNPALGNAAGEAQWAPEDAFVGVESPPAYWTATEHDAGNAWLVNFLDGEVEPAPKAFLLQAWPVRSEQ